VGPGIERLDGGREARGRPAYGHDRAVASGDPGRPLRTARTILIRSRAPPRVCPGCSDRSDEGPPRRGHAPSEVGGRASWPPRLAAHRAEHQRGRNDLHPRSAVNLGPAPQRTGRARRRRKQACWRCRQCSQARVPHRSAADEGSTSHHRTSRWGHTRRVDRRPFSTRRAGTTVP